MKFLETILKRSLKRENRKYTASAIGWGIETSRQKLCTFNSNFDQFANTRDILVKMFSINYDISVTKSHYYYKVP